MIYTVGHSTLSMIDFVEAMGPATTLIDARSHPTSKWSQFQRTNMDAWLPAAGKGYEYWGGLGGWTTRHAGLAPEFKRFRVDVEAYSHGHFPKGHVAKSLPPRVMPSWTSVGFRDYSYFMSLHEFLVACDKLIKRGDKEDVAICCAELVWWHCHRSLVSDYLWWRGIDSVHLMNGRRTKHSKVVGDRLLRYEPFTLEMWVAHREFTPEYA